MDRALYAKGHALVRGGRVRIEEETENAVYFVVRGEHDEYKVRIERDHTFTCTCPYATLQGLPKGALCSHAVACILFAAAAHAPSKSPAGRSPAAKK